MHSRGEGRWECPEKARERKRRWREANPEKQREAELRWKKRNPDKVQRMNARRLRVCGIYVGMIGFTETEIKEMVQRGETH